MVSTKAIAKIREIIVFSEIEGGIVILHVIVKKYGFT
jgi:hypothetical protein